MNAYCGDTAISPLCFMLSMAWYKIQWSRDVGFPSVCCEYVSLPLVNNKAVLANDLAQHSQARRYK